MIRSLPISEKIVKIANRIAHSVIAFVSDSHAYLIKDGVAMFRIRVPRNQPFQFFEEP